MHGRTPSPATQRRTISLAPSVLLSKTIVEGSWGEPGRFFHPADTLKPTYSPSRNEKCLLEKEVTLERKAVKSTYNTIMQQFKQWGERRSSPGTDSLIGS